MAWKQTSPVRFVRTCGNDEIFMKLAGEIIPNRNNWAVWITARLRVSPSLSRHVISGLRKAWIQLRYRVPFVAAVAIGTQMVYEVPDEVALEDWVRTSFFIENCKTIDEFLAEPHNTPYINLHYFPNTCEVLLSGPHYMCDGAGTQQALKLLINFLAEDGPVPDFGDEWTRLGPGLETLSHVDPWPAQVAEAVSKRCLGLFGTPPDTPPGDKPDPFVSIPLTDSYLTNGSTHASSNPLTPTTDVQAIRRQPSFTLNTLNAVKRGIGTFFGNASPSSNAKNAAPAVVVPAAPKKSPTPGSVRRIPTTLTTSTSDAIVAACKARKFTVTASLHAAMISTCDRDPRTVSSSSYHTTNVPANGRRYMPEPYNDLDNIPIGLGLLALPLRILKSDYNDMAQSLTKAYRAPLENGAGSFLHKYFVYEQMILANSGPQKSDMPTPAEPLQPGLSSMGFFDKIVPRTAVGTYEVEVEDVDFGFEQLQDMLLLYLSNFRGKIKICANYNDAFWSEEFVREFMADAQELWFQELGIEVVKHEGTYHVAPSDSFQSITPLTNIHAEIVKLSIISDTVTSDHIPRRSPPGSIQLFKQSGIIEVVSSEPAHTITNRTAERDFQNSEASSPLTSQTSNTFTLSLPARTGVSAAGAAVPVKRKVKPPIKPKPKKLSVSSNEDILARQLEEVNEDLGLLHFLPNDSKQATRPVTIVFDDPAFADELAVFNSDLSLLHGHESSKPEGEDIKMTDMNDIGLARRLEALDDDLCVVHGGGSNKKQATKPKKRTSVKKREFDKRTLQSSDLHNLPPKKRMTMSQSPPRYNYTRQVSGKDIPVCQQEEGHMTPVRETRNPTRYSRSKPFERLGYERRPPNNARVLCGPGAPSHVGGPGGAAMYPQPEEDVSEVQASGETDLTSKSPDVWAEEPVVPDNPPVVCGVDALATESGLSHVYCYSPNGVVPIR